jgi:pantoate--beta-alanine ligase
MEIIRTPSMMKETSKRLLMKGRTIGFVPTMGALHEGHLYLSKCARSENDVVVASIFVNPTQFGPTEDFEQYPREFESDRQKLETASVDILFVPDVPAMYPEGFATSVEVKGLSEKLCGALRPGHFRGVATIVCKFFNMVLPTRAYFGQKDFQQALIIQKMIGDLNLNVESIICATVREGDGLAMSSRNRYLLPAERKAATALYKTLQSSARMVETGTEPRVIMERMQAMLKAEPLITEVQYAGLYDPETLNERIATGKRNLLAIAVRIGNTRLIDNIVVGQ